MRRLLPLAIALLAAAPAAAQETVALSTGFTPDPAVVTGRTAGTTPINRVASGCRGYVGDAPDAVLELETRFGFLRLFVLAPRAVTLAVRDAAGRWHCSGRPLDGAPREEGRFAPGRAEVWIGSAQLGTEVPYELRVTEFRSVTPATGSVERATPTGGGADLGLLVRADAGLHRGRRLRRGFLPDPRMDDGATGGDVDVRLLGGQCRGYVREAPSHVMTLRTDFDYFRIQLGEVPGEATLIVRTPGGRWLCDAPEERNARVERDEWPEGDYRIWVGTEEPGVERRYRICYTEARPPEGRTRCGDPALNVPRSRATDATDAEDASSSGHGASTGEGRARDGD